MCLNFHPMRQIRRALAWLSDTLFFESQVRRCIGGQRRFDTATQVSETTIRQNIFETIRHKRIMFSQKKE